MAAGVPADALGRRVLCGTEYGTVRYVGSVSPTAGKQRRGKQPSRWPASVLMVLFLIQLW